MNVLFTLKFMAVGYAVDTRLNSVAGEFEEVSQIADVHAVPVASGFTISFCVFVHQACPLFGAAN